MEHRPGLQVQETQYDPAGLELAGLAAPSPGIRGLNNYRFNGKEFQADLGLAWNHQDWRFLDPQLLRWHSGDPEVENGQESWTPYSFSYDNAVRYSDANGRQGVPGTGGVAQGALDNEFRKVDQSVRSAYHTVANAVSNVATSVANFFTDSHEGSTDLKPRNSPGLGFFNSGTSGSENHLGGTQEGSAVDVSNFPSPVPSDPAKKAITFMAKLGAVNDFVSSSFGAVAVADKVSNGKVSGAIEGAVTGKNLKIERPRLIHSDTSAAGQGFAGKDGKVYRVIYEQHIQDGRVVNSSRPIPFK